MAYDGDGFWQEDEDPYKYADFTQQGNGGTTEHTYTPEQGEQNHFVWNNGDPWAPTPSGHPTADANFNGGTPAPSTTPPPTTTPPPKAPPSGGGGGGGSQPPPRTPYKPPSMTPSPFIMPNGMIPPGMPFSPDPRAVEQQNRALEQAMTPAIQQFVNPYQGAQDALMQKFLSEPQFGPDYINALNEQQKEISLAREGQAKRGLMQRSASRGVMAGGQVQSGMKRINDATSQNLLQSNRDINIQTQEANRGGFERALGISDQLAGGMADRMFRTDAGNRQALLDAIGQSENVYGGREDRGLNVSRLMEMIRQFDNDMSERQSEFASNGQFNYDNMNSMNEKSWLDYLARLAGR